MQTSSVDEFNKVFAAIEVQKTLDDLNQSSTAYAKCVNYTADDILPVAEAQYLNLFEKGQWTGASTKWQDLAFAAQQWSNAKFQKCHNCGKPGCRLDICSTPKDEEKIKKNRQLFLDSRKQGGGGPKAGSEHQKSGDKSDSKWRKPDANENGKMHIDGKHMYYHYRSGKWKVVDRTPSQNAEQKKSASAKATKVAAASLLAQAAATPAPVAGMTAALTLPTAAPSQDKLKAVNRAKLKLMMEQLSLAMKSELDNP
jgi:hypothetical protein